MTSTFQAQNLFLGSCFIFLSYVSSLMTLVQAFRILEEVLSMLVKHSRSIHFGLTNLFSK